MIENTPVRKTAPHGTTGIKSVDGSEAQHDWKEARQPIFVQHRCARPHGRVLDPPFGLRPFATPITAPKLKLAVTSESLARPRPAQNLQATKSRRSKQG